MLALTVDSKIRLIARSGARLGRFESLTQGVNFMGGVENSAIVFRTLSGESIAKLCPSALVTPISVNLQYQMRSKIHESGICRPAAFTWYACVVDSPHVPRI